MRILLDQGVPAPLRKFLHGHSVETAQERGWATLSNGELISRAELDGFDLLVTTDQNLPYQQELANRKVAIVVLTRASWPAIQRHVERVITAVNSCKPGEFKVVRIG